MSGSLADRFKSGSQKAGNVTEAWGAENFYCPNCSAPKLDWLLPSPRLRRGEQAGNQGPALGQHFLPSLPGLVRGRAFYPALKGWAIVGICRSERSLNPWLADDSIKISRRTALPILSLYLCVPVANPLRFYVKIVSVPIVRRQTDPSSPCCAATSRGWSRGIPVGAGAVGCHEKNEAKLERSIHLCNLYCHGVHHQSAHHGTRGFFRRV